MYVWTENSIKWLLEKVKEQTQSPRSFGPVQIPVSAWVANSTYTDYPYRASVSLSGVIASMIPEVVFSVAALSENDFAPVAECYDGGVYIYSDGIPSAAITIPTITCWRGGGQHGMIGSTNAGGGGQLKSAIIVTAPTGSTVTATSGGTVKNAAEKNGVWTFQRLDLGTWTITATKGGKTATQTVNVTDINVYRVKLGYVHVYGIQRDITNPSPAWTRTDEAVGLTATATVGTVAGHSDFSNCYPWSGITRETLSTGDVMVKIPKFWYRRYRSGNVEYLKIANKATTGFTLHPAFNHGGVAKDYIYVGAYKTTNGNKSASGASPLANQTRATMRTNAKAKGTGWGIIDISTLSAIQMLILVEFANNNVQSVIGLGNCDSDSACQTGTCNNVSGLTGRPAGTNGKVDVVWRGIEGLWGNVWEWVDGVNWNNGTYYVCNDPSKYADDTTTNYTALSFNGATNWSSSYITQEGLDTGSNPHVMLPSAAGSGSETTYYCDACWSNTDWLVFRRGGDWTDGSVCGLFAALFYNASSFSSSATGSRLLYIPA